MAYNPGKFLSALLFNRLRRSHSPRLVTFLITFRCNLRCSMCAIPSIKHGGELDADEIEQIFRQLGRLDAVRISGGEPFLRTDLPAVIGRIDRWSRPGKLVISSNGTLGTRMLEFVSAFARPRSLHLEISLDGVGEVHDRIRGREGTYKQVIETLEALAKVRSSRLFSLSVAQTIVDSDGFAGYERLCAETERFGVDVFPNVAYDAETALYSGPEMQSDPRRAYGYDEGFLRELDSFLGKLSRKNYRSAGVAMAKRYYLRGLRNRLVDKRNDPSPPCTALYSHLRINPDGAVPVCMHNSRAVGNLRETPFEAVWSGPEARKERAWVDRCPGCWTGCETLPSAIYSGDIILSKFQASKHRG